MKLIIAIFLATCVTSSYGAEITFSKQYNDGIDSVIELSNGDYIASSPDYGNPTLIRLDKNGSVIYAWEYVVQNRLSTSIYGLIETQDGGYLGTGNDLKDPLIIKFDSIGVPQWQIAIQGRYYINSIAQTNDGGYIAVGTKYSASFESDAWIIKLNRGGGVAWSKILHEESGDSFQFVEQAKDGGFIVVGRVETNIIIAKLNAQGKLISNRIYSFDETFSGTISGVTVTPSEGLVLVGSIGTSAVLLKVGSRGGIDWAKAFSNKPHVLGLSSIVHTKDGAFVAAGTSDQFRGPDHRGLLLKVTGFGKLIWSRKSHAELSSVNETQDKGLSFVGSGAAFWGILKSDSRGFIPNCSILRRFPLSARSLRIKEILGQGITLTPVNVQVESFSIMPKRLSVSGEDFCN